MKTKAKLYTLLFAMTGTRPDHASIVAMYHKLYKRGL